MKRILIPLAIILICSIILLGCGTSTTTAPTTTTKPPTTSTPATTTPSVIPQSGGTLKVYHQANPNSLGYPVDIIGRDISAASYCLDSLFDETLQGEIVPRLATGYKLDPVAKTITITLRKGVKFHDGSDFNAAVCKWNLDMFRTSNRIELKLVSSIDVIDDYTVRLNLSEFQNTILSQLCGAAGKMISKAAFEANGGKDWAGENPVGTGPFKFVSWEKDRLIKYTRFDGYWGGKPYLDGVNLQIYADANVAELDLQAGNLDIMAVPPKSVKSLLDSGKFYMIERVTGQAPSIAGDATKPPFNDLRVRQAISYALDTKAMADTFGYGYYTNTNQWAIPGTWGYNPNVIGYPYNPQKARQLLAAAGYPNGFKTILHYNTFQPQYTDWATSIQSYLKDIGIELTLDPLKPSVYNDLAFMGKGFDGMIHVMGSAQLDPLLTYANIATGVEFTNMLKPQEFKDTYAKAVTAVDRETKQKLVWELQYLAVDKYCMQTFFWVEKSNLATNIKLKDIRLSSVSLGIIDAAKAWFSK